MKQTQNLSRRERAATPFPLAQLLVGKVSRAFGARRVAVLWTQPNTNYRRLGRRVDLWGVERDARTYPGPWPIVAHPPCGPWGKLAWRSQESAVDGIVAMRLVHRYGGIVEQPFGSSLFRDLGQDGIVKRIFQQDYGHPALKPTLLYMVGVTW